MNFTLEPIHIRSKIKIPKSHKLFLNYTQYDIIANEVMNNDK